MIAESYNDGILLKSAVAVPIETYRRERKAEFLLSNAINQADYQEARKAVEAMGINPDDVKHHKPTD